MAEHKKFLYLVRHAKSSWSDSGLPDHERPLNRRGEHDAPRMGRRLEKREVRPGLIVSSSAVRALATAQVLARELGVRPEEVVVDERIYGADTDELIELIHTFDDRHHRVMLVGHNPTMTDLVNNLTGSHVGNMPTCSVATLGFGAVDWREAGQAELLDFDYPKNAD